MKEISFWKTQWWNLVVAAVMLVTAFINLFQIAFTIPAAPATVEIVNHAIMATFCFTCMTIWLLTAVINYNALKVEQLERRIDILENRAITDIEEESPKYYVVKRKLGPDKEN